MTFAIRRAALALLAVAILALSVTACGSSDKKSSSTKAPSGQPGKGKSVTLGDKNFTEEFVLGELYKQALEARGYKVSLKSNIGSSEIIDKALTSGKIDGYPEYTGTIISSLAHKDQPLKSQDDAYNQAKSFEEGRGYTLTAKTPFFDADAIAVKPDYAKKNGLSKLDDLAKLGAKFRLGGPPENKTRYLGVVGLKKVYGANLTFVPLTIGLQYKALDSGKVDGATVFTTDGQLQRSQYTILKDDKNLFGFQNVAMVISQKKLKELGPEFQQTVDAVSATLNNEAMQKMNAAIDIDKQKPAAVAKTFLKANGLL
ncbi:MAG: osmoprotectant transport system substrate-binding protein [Thermoleophilaceae bacterium]|nr:osmoprotectant transport system substrate-binding protein [Thermoleophilaceae bacterium]